MVNLFDLKGKKAKCYDSFNGVNTSLVVESIKVFDRWLVMRGTDTQWGVNAIISVPLEVLDELMMFGKATVHEEVDHCTIHKDYRIN